MTPQLKDLDKLPVPIIDDFRKTGKSRAIPKYLQDYIRQLDRVAELRNAGYEHNIYRTALELQKTFPNLALTTARERVADAINYFHLNSTVKKEAWFNYYADRMEDLHKYALSHDNITEARRCMEKAMEYRKMASDNSINPDDFKIKVELISPDVDAKRLGFKEEFNMLTLWSDTEKFVKQLPIDKQDKQRALNDAAGALGIEDVDYEEV